jgi:putative oxidoreductase
MVNSLTGLGKWLLIIPFAAFGIMHLMGADKMAGMVPSYFPGGTLWVYLTGLAQIAFAASVVLGKFDKLGAVLTALMLIVFILTIHLPGAMKGDQMSMIGLLKDLGLAGGALLYAGSYAKDGSYAS